MRTKLSKREREGDRERELKRCVNGAHVPMKVRLIHLYEDNRLFPTFLQHAKLISGPIYTRPVSAIHTEHERSRLRKRYIIIARRVKKSIVSELVIVVKIKRAGEGWRQRRGFSFTLFAINGRYAYEDQSVLHRAEVLYFHGDV